MTYAEGLVRYLRALLKAHKVTVAQANAYYATKMRAYTAYQAAHRPKPKAPTPVDPGLAATERVVGLIPGAGPVIVQAFNAIASATGLDQPYQLNSEADLQNVLRTASLTGIDTWQVISLWNRAHPELAYDPSTNRRLAPPAPVAPATASPGIDAGGRPSGGGGRLLTSIRILRE